MDGETIGSIVGVVFGCAWGVGGATGLPEARRAWALGFAIGISGLLIAALVWPHKRTEAGVFRGRIYGMAVVFELVAIVAAIWLVRRLGLPQLLMPVIGFIVGVHFLGLWKATDLKVFLWTSLAMCLVCGVAAFLPDAKANDNIDLHRVVAGLGSALLLWAASASSLVGRFVRGS